MNEKIHRSFVVLLLYLFPLICNSAVKPIERKGKVLEKSFPQFVRSLSLLNDRLLLVACERNGVFSLPLDDVDKNLTHFPGTEGSISLTCDWGGDVWVGLRRNGVLHLRQKGYSGTELIERIGPLDGIGGTQVRAMFAYKDGMWFVTENGVSHRGRRGSWIGFTPYKWGLPVSPTAICGLPNGELCVVGSNGGMARRKRGLWAQYVADRELAAFRINDVLSAPGGHLWIAAQEGLLRRRSDGALLRFSPEADGVAKEDAITCLCLSDQGQVLCGTRKAGLLCFDPVAEEWRRLPKGENGPPDGYVSAILALGSGHLAVGTYGYGMRVLATPTWSVGVEAHRSLPDAVQHSFGSTTSYLGEDRSTQGNWMGRYGTAAWALAAMGRPHDYVGGPEKARFTCLPKMGEKHRKGDGTRHWVHWLQTDDRRSLRCPVQPSRRQASWDDAGELYPPNQGGPNLVVDLSIPPGDWLVSLYFVNIDAMDCPASWRTSDGFLLPNRFRDYRVEVRTRGMKESAPPLASARVNDFCAGVYHRFRLPGGSYTVTIRRGRSHNTILSAVFLDPAPQRAGAPQLIAEAVRVAQELKAGRVPSSTNAEEIAIALHQAAEFGMAEDLFAALGEGWLCAARHQDKHSRDTLLAAWKECCFRVCRQLHVPAHQRFVNYGHDPNTISSLLFIPYVEFLLQSGASERLRLLVPLVPGEEKQLITAMMASYDNENRHEMMEWLSNPNMAMNPMDSIANSISVCQTNGNKQSIEYLKMAIDTMIRK
jgi:hypothetical protein